MVLFGFYKKYISFIIVCLLFPFLANAQRVVEFTRNQGVNSGIMGLGGDSRGGVWVATRNGLNRYDGVKMHSYRKKAGDIMSLKSNLTTCVCEYDRDHMLIGSDEGIQSYSYATDRFTDVPMISLTGDTINVRVIEMRPLSGGEVFACVAEWGCAIVSRDAEGRLFGKLTTRYLTKDGDESPRYMIEDGKRRIWHVNRADGIRCFSNGKSQHVDSDYKGAMCNFCLAGGKVFLATRDNGLLVYSESKSRFVTAPCVGEMPRDIFRIRAWGNDNIFICTQGNGMYIYSVSKGAIADASSVFSGVPVKGMNIRDAFCDAYGNVWVAVFWKGLYMVPAERASAFVYMGHSSFSRDVVGNNSISAVCAASCSDGGTLGDVWVAVDNDGFYRVHSNGTKSRHWIGGAALSVPVSVKSLFQDRKGTLWIGSYYDGLYSMDTKTESVVMRKPGVGKVYDIKEDALGNVWFATMGNGFYCYEAEHDILRRFVTNDGSMPNPEVMKPNRYASCILPLKDKVIVGTADGVEVYARKGNAVVPLRPRLMERTGVNDIKMDGKGRLWVACNAGLACISLKDYSMKIYSEPEFLPNSVVNAIEIADGSVWASTDDGLVRIGMEDGKHDTYFSEDGLLGDEFSQHASCKIGSYLLFGGTHGLVAFCPKDLGSKREARKFTLKIVDMYVDNQMEHAPVGEVDEPVLTKAVDECDTVFIPYDHQQVSFEICAPAMHGYTLTYYYRIDGGEWLHGDMRSNFIKLHNLSPGTYRLSIMARTVGGESEVRELTLVVRSPWWDSRTAWCIYLLLALVLGYVAWVQISNYRRSRRILKHHRHVQELNDARMEFFMNVSHEIRTPLTLIMAPVEKLMKQDDDEGRRANYKLVKQNSERILNIVNQMLDVRKIDRGQMKLLFSTTDMVALVKGVCNVFEENAQSRGIDFVVSCKEERLMAQVDVDSMDKIIMNLLSNAFKFTEGSGRICLELLRLADGEQMAIRVTDTGKGISDEDKPHVFERFYSPRQKSGNKGIGIGLNLVQMLVKLHGGTVSVADNPDGKGAVFEVVLPLKQNDSPGYMDAEEAAETAGWKRCDEGELPGLTEGVDSLKGCKIVLVEDDSAIREYVKAELGEGMQVEAFENGEQAWNHVLATPEDIDLVISDIMMPVMSGMTLCQNIKSNPLTSHIPVLLMTALASNSDRIVGITNGADGYVTKPLDMQLFVSTAANIVRNHRILKNKLSNDVLVASHVERKEVESVEDKLLETIMEVVNSNLDNSEFSIDEFALQVGMSRANFFKKMKELTGQSPNDFIKYVRLKEASRMLSEGKMTVSEVADATGFKYLATFSSSFKSLFGASPKEWQQKCVGGNDK